LNVDAASPNPRFFASPRAFRAWLERHHASETPLLVGFWKVGTGRPSLTWSEAVDEALCYGWIDGIRRSLGEEAYSVRFTPRKGRSRWSAVNRGKAKALIAAGRMMPAGLKAWEARPEGEHAGASYEVGGADRLPPPMEKRIRANAAAWAWFRARPPGERRTTVHWVTGARQEATRLRRLDLLIATAAQGVHVPPLKLLDRKRPKVASGVAAGRRAGTR
jgi:uncharacterized protein YdeI (YjbR/CyaY-like superfamily)